MRAFIVLTLCVAGGLAQADERADKLSALLQAQGLTQTFEARLQASWQQAQQLANQVLSKSLVGSNLPPPFQEQVKQAMADYLNSVKSPFSAQQMVDIWGKYYGASFSDAELDQLLVFYQGPLGQKEVLASREALKPYMADYMARYQPIIEQAVQTLTARMRQIVADCHCRQ